MNIFCISKMEGQVGHSVHWFSLQFRRLTAIEFYTKFARREACALEDAYLMCVPVKLWFAMASQVIQWIKNPLAM